MKSASASGQDVWARIWQHIPTETEDRHHLARERHSPRWARLSEAMLRIYGRIADLRVIELGSGRGDMAVLLAQCGARVTLLDNSPAALDQARRRFARLGLTAEYEEADLLHIPEHLQGGFDISTSLGVVEHFRGTERSRAIATHAEVLRPGGLTLIGVPNAACLPYRLWKLYLQARGWWPYGLEIPYSRRELRQRAGEAGLKCVDLFAYGWWQSVAEQWGRGVFHADWKCADRRSVLDERMGINLVLIAQRLETA